MPEKVTRPAPSSAPGSTRSSAPGRLPGSAPGRMPGSAPVSMLEEGTSSEVAARAACTLLVVPLGATEQHGPHLPLGTDTAVADALAVGLARCRPDVVVAPALPFGASGEHAGFAGTLSIGTEVVTALLVELVRSADAFRGVVLVNAHGGNQAALDAACRQSWADGRDVLAFTPSRTMLASTAQRYGARVDAHAGWVETSLMLALHPSAVRSDRAAAGNCRPIQELMGELRSGGVLSVSGIGVLGDPAGSTALAGQALFEQLLAELVAVVTARWGPSAAHARAPFASGLHAGAGSGADFTSGTAAGSGSNEGHSAKPTSVGTAVSPGPSASRVLPGEAGSNEAVNPEIAGSAGTGANLGRRAR